MIEWMRGESERGGEKKDASGGGEGKWSSAHTYIHEHVRGRRYRKTGKWGVQVCDCCRGDESEAKERANTCTACESDRKSVEIQN